MTLTEVTDEYKCCCSCRNNIRTHDKVWGCVCHCDRDGHYIGYVENLTQVCEEWKMMSDYIERKAAYEATAVDPGTDTISRAKAIEALKNDMASLDNIIKGMSANDVRLDAYVSQRNQVNYDIYTINSLPPIQSEAYNRGYAQGYKDAKAEQPEPHWIPVTERLPETTDPVNVT